jgi:hypothetical protein
MKAIEQRRKLSKQSRDYENTGEDEEFFFELLELVQ